MIRRTRTTHSTARPAHAHAAARRPPPRPAGARQKARGQPPRARGSRVQALMDQPTLFEQIKQGRVIPSEQLLLYALGEFQARGKQLAARELPLDRLRGAIRRATETFDVAELTDEEAAAAFESL